MDIRGRTALITGGSAGVGLALARALLGAGANVAITGRDGARLDEAAAALGAAERVATIRWDVADVGRADEMFAAVERRFGGLHLLVNNAGCNHRGTLEELTVDEVLHIVDTNLRAPLALTRAALPFIRRAGGGAIVNVASLAGRVPFAHETVYCATKFGLRAFTLALAEELAGSGITASVVSPGPISTGFILDDIDAIPDLVFSQPMSSAEEVAQAILACVRDGRRERALPRTSGWLAHLGYLFPALRRAVAPLMQRRGRRAKAHWRQELARR
ncbi:MAG: 3-phenylpropionate-dihydrodiol/cinnamic acid-dihydrodiol dehydrogenase [Pseudomonadales bacterium]|nr:3-phenylpropionate-dihydrodiol/cinnamic acid-dihydrodiol dehydrogenase [Pseudomonadales bacterium]